MITAIGISLVLLGLFINKVLIHAGITSKYYWTSADWFSVTPVWIGYVLLGYSIIRLLIKYLP